MADKEFNDYLPLDQCHPEGQLEKSFGYKPTLQGAVAAVLAVLVVVLERNTVVRVFSGIVLAACAYLLIFYKDHTVMTVYDQGVLVYAENDPAKAVYLPWEQIAKWMVKRDNGLHVIFLQLADGRYLYLETFNTLHVRKTLSEYMPDKQN
jgi:hypothetical protein